MTSRMTATDELRSLLDEADALERRIAKLENDQMLTMQTSPEKMPLKVAISYLEGMAHVAQRRVRELDALEQRIEKLERKLGGWRYERHAQEKARALHGRRWVHPPLLGVRQCHRLERRGRMVQRQRHAD